MNRKLIIDGNAVYEIDEDCMLKRRQDQNEKTDGIPSGSRIKDRKGQQDQQKSQEGQ